MYSKYSGTEFEVTFKSLNSLWQALGGSDGPWVFCELFDQSTLLLSSSACLPLHCMQEDDQGYIILREGDLLSVLSWVLRTSFHCCWGLWNDPGRIFCPCLSVAAGAIIIYDIYQQPYIGRATGDKHKAYKQGIPCRIRYWLCLLYTGTYWELSSSSFSLVKEDYLPMLGRLVWLARNSNTQKREFILGKIAGKLRGNWLKTRKGTSGR